jgi:hypothetical protein
MEIEEKELGRIKKSNSAEIILKVSSYKGEYGVDIREYVTTETYTGYTKKGTRIPLAQWDTFKKIVDSYTAKQ